MESSVFPVRSLLSLSNHSSFMKLLLLVFTVTLLLAQVTPVMKCWGKSGRCRTMCKESEVYYLLCNTKAKCCVDPKYVPVEPPKLPNTNTSLESISAV
nr:beta-defensin 121 isoform X2 [Callithrix jacchus]